MNDAPRIEDAPGLVLRKRRGGWSACWQARSDLVAKGFTPKFVTLAYIGHEPDAETLAWISDRCRALQDEMLVFGRGGLPVVGKFDGTLRSLMRVYQTDPDSTYRKARYHTRLNYDSLIRKLDVHGDIWLSDIKPRMLLRWHEDWMMIGIPIAHSCMAMLRTILGFGATILENDECQRLRGLLHGMKFKMAPPRTEVLTAEMAIAVRAKAHEIGFPMVALAQAIQFECTLRQKDVLGEWVPTSEAGVSDVLDERCGRKWLRGVRWDEIDSNLILRHTTSKKGKDIEVDLRLAPMVMEEFAKLGALPASGPMILDRGTGIPYRNHQFRKHWRKVADAAGVPKGIWNMDSRAGAITEGTDSGASLEDVRHAATHSDIAMTQKYSRAQAKKTAAVMQMRVAHRNKPGTNQ